MLAIGQELYKGAPCSTQAVSLTLQLPRQM